LTNSLKTANDVKKTYKTKKKQKQTIQ